MGKNLTDADLLDELEAAITKTGLASEWARQHSFSQGYVSLVRSGRREMSEAMANALGYEWVREWKLKKKG